MLIHDHDLTIEAALLPATFIIMRIERCSCFHTDLERYSKEGVRWRPSAGPGSSRERESAGNRGLCGLFSSGISPAWRVRIRAAVTDNQPGVLMEEGRIALVAEGGGMRGIFTAGVLDAFLRERFNPFDMLIGVSAGAVSLASYLSGQYQRYYRFSAGPMRSREFLSFARFLKGGHFMDLNWLWDYASIRDPLDVEATVGDGSREFLVAVTDVRTGDAQFMRPDAADLLDVLLASSALPVLYRGFARLDGKPVADGGIAAPLPVKEAYLRGARRIVVIRTRQAGQIKGWLADTFMTTLFLKRFPALCRSVRRLSRAYREAVDFIQNPPGDAQVFQIAPPRKLRSSRLKADSRTIRSDYELGLQEGGRFVEGAGRQILMGKTPQPLQNAPRSILQQPTQDELQDP